ncbi:MAG: MMPL family transporter, partial [Thermoleophilaceae bacterium]
MRSRGAQPEESGGGRGAGMTGRWARWCALHPRRTVAAWLVAAVVSAVVSATLLSGALTTQSTFTGTPESQRALDLIQQRLGRKQPLLDVVIVGSSAQTVDQPGFRRRVDSLQAEIARLRSTGVRVGPTYYQTQAPALVSKDRHSTLITISMPGSEVNQAHTKIGPVIALADRASGHGGFRVLVTGDATLSRDFT